MPQLGLLYMLIAMPMNILSGSNTPLESMPHWLATIMQASPSTHFVSFAQSILYRGAGIDVVWPQFLAVAAIGGYFSRRHFYVSVSPQRRVEPGHALGSNFGERLAAERSALILHADPGGIEA